MCPQRKLQAVIRKWTFFNEPWFSSCLSVSGCENTYQGGVVWDLCCVCACLLSMSLLRALSALPLIAEQEESQTNQAKQGELAKSRNRFTNLDDGF